ncbi:AraC family transcriptional regulator [Bacillus stercoris]|uniref:AraC family transcriptional regulator n=1 Tax=Bacillus TaxID=1386 RepID=UPI0004E7960E|nr:MULTISPECIES: AraC family transcriptional regulator [Bacillus]OEI73673.1 AraC family transcriptional regulator [Bacillus subtilis]KFF57399.1 AraC family transcriptional regulator [Bacillus subtilis] [Bacillus stercoris]MCB7152368.1 AraC family transcriptional regulator [Bacillus stercoris]MDN0191322.1 AraC family transcriptional regulator [Bacillus sp. B.PNR1]MDN3032228.1 AraC family transcriptional regulator [Bacillus sp. B.PNR2]
MPRILFTVPPFPVFIAAGEGVFKKGETHVKRVFSVFDLIYVKDGTLYITENEKSFSIEGGEYILLSPGLEHYGTKGSDEATSYYWLHFDEHRYEFTAKGGSNWSELQQEKGSFEEPARYGLALPRKGKVQRPQFMAQQFERLIDYSAENSDLPLRKQILFEELMLHLQKEAFQIPSAKERVAWEAARYLQEHYKEKTTIKDLSLALHYHQDYVSRCMQQVLGVTPAQYTNRVRMTEAKRLLSSTNDKMGVIAETVGMEDPTYFSKLFKQIEGISPIEYRKIVSRKVQ